MLLLLLHCIAWHCRNASVKATINQSHIRDSPGRVSERLPPVCHTRFPERVNALSNTMTNSVVRIQTASYTVTLPRFPPKLTVSCVGLQLFEPLLKQNPKALEKVVPLEGQVNAVDMGLSEKDQQLIVDTVSVVFHLAASLDWRCTLKRAVTDNTAGTRNVMEFCSRIKNITVRQRYALGFCSPIRIENLELAVFATGAGVHIDGVLPVRGGRDGGAHLQAQGGPGHRARAVREAGRRSLAGHDPGVSINCFYNRKKEG